MATARAETFPSSAETLLLLTDHCFCPLLILPAGHFAWDERGEQTFGWITTCRGSISPKGEKELSPVDIRNYINHVNGKGSQSVETQSKTANSAKLIGKFGETEERASHLLSTKTKLLNFSKADLEKTKCINQLDFQGECAKKATICRVSKSIWRSYAAEENKVYSSNWKNKKKQKTNKTSPE